jgi:hypothetical protein
MFKAPGREDASLVDRLGCSTPRRRALRSLLWGGSELGRALLDDQSLSLRIRSPHAFAFLAMFGAALLEFVGQNLRTPAHP